MEAAREAAPCLVLQPQEDLPNSTILDLLLNPEGLAPQDSIVGLKLWKVVQSTSVLLDQRLAKCFCLHQKNSMLNVTSIMHALL